MSFLHSAFIEVSDEAISWLEDTLGCGMILAAVENEDDMWILFDHEFGGWQFVDSEVKGMILNSDNGEINCLCNIPLFKAVTAMRDGTDLHKVFICGEELDCFFTSDYDSVEKHIHEKMDGWDTYNCRKATLEEIINHFKKVDNEGNFS